jgi:hypothetical protein
MDEALFAKGRAMSGSSLMRGGMDGQDEPTMTARARQSHRMADRQLIPKLSKRDSEGGIPESACV